jgi:hypothetical protein
MYTSCGRPRAHTYTHTYTHNTHTHTQVANYPWDGYPDKGMDERKTRNPTPDDITFRFLAKSYASLHTFMSKSTVGWEAEGVATWLDGPLIHLLQALIPCRAVKSSDAPRCTRDQAEWIPGPTRRPDLAWTSLLLACTCVPRSLKTASPTARSGTLCEPHKNLTLLRGALGSRVSERRGIWQCRGPAGQELRLRGHRAVGAALVAKERFSVAPAPTARGPLLPDTSPPPPASPRVHRLAMEACR